MEKCLYENILTLTKSLTTLYLNGTIESSNEDVRKVFDNGLAENLKLHDELYQAMKEDEIKKFSEKLNKE